MKLIKDRSLLLVSIMVLFLLSLILFYSHISRRPDKSVVNTWLIYNNRVDYVTKDGTLIRDENRRSGITVLPSNYVMQSVQYQIVSYSFSDNIEKTHTVFDSLPEFTGVKLLPNKIDASKLWILTFFEDDCSEDKLSPDEVAIPQRYCKFKLYEFDLQTDKLTEKKEFKSGVGASIRNVYLLAHDPIENNVWLGVDRHLANVQEGQTESHASDPTNIDNPRVGTELIKYNADTGGELFIQTPYWMSSRFKPLHKTLAEPDKNGELYFIGECSYDCENRQYINEGLVASFNNKVNPVSMFYYGQDPGSVRGFQITTDNQNDYVYLITKSFDPYMFSNVFGYDPSTGRSMHIGKQPTPEEDDLRGSDVIEGKLAVGSFSGLYIYDPDMDDWEVIKLSDGIKSDNVEGVYGIDGGGVCLVHEKDGASCLFESLKAYLEATK